jgi:endonuclease YncB( thermonuclease family)
VIQVSPFFLLNRFLRALGMVSLVALAFWAWHNREVADPIFNIYRAWRLGEPTTVPFEERQLIVMKPINGESLQAKDDAGTIFTVRLAGVQAPDATSPVRRVREAAWASRDFLGRQAGTNRVRVEITLTNESKVLLGVVYRGKTNLNAACVASGHALFQRDYLVGTSFRCRYALLQAERRAHAHGHHPVIR